MQSSVHPRIPKLNQNRSGAFEGACWCSVELCSGGCMRRVSEGPLRKSQLRGALTHLLDGPAAVDFKRRKPRSQEKPIRATRKNIYLRRSCEPTGVAWGTTEYGTQYRRVWNNPVHVLMDTNTSFTQWISMQIMPSIARF